MGISMGLLQTMEELGVLGAGRAFLDFGSSNLYGASEVEIRSFITRHSARADVDLSAVSHRLASGSGKDPGGTNLNAAFVGELLEAAGMKYDSIDIAVGYKTTVVDLNSNLLPKHMLGAYDSVVNCGTSEHILNQMNTFAAVHAAARLGGMMLHQVPSVGYVDHGYFCYTSRFFFDLAGYNEYEVVDMWFDKSDYTENVFATARQYQTYFPALTRRLAKIFSDKREAEINKIEIPIISMTILYRKVRDKPFMGTVETSTSVGHVPETVTETYSPTSTEVKLAGA